jgi:hypothetical protein
MLAEKWANISMLAEKWAKCSLAGHRITAIVFSRRIKEVARMFKYIRVLSVIGLAMLFWGCGGGGGTTSSAGGGNTGGGTTSGTTTVKIAINAKTVRSLRFDVTYDASKVSYKSIAASGVASTAQIMPSDTGSKAAVALAQATDITGPGDVAVLTFTTVSGTPAGGDFTLTLTEASGFDENTQSTTSVTGVNLSASVTNN